MHCWAFMPLYSPHSSTALHCKYLKTFHACKVLSWSLKRIAWRNYYGCAFGMHHAFWSNFPQCYDLSRGCFQILPGMIISRFLVLLLFCLQMFFRSNPDWFIGWCSLAIFDAFGIQHKLDSLLDKSYITSG